MHPQQPPLRCLTVWQPWASLIIDGTKDIENRRWPLPHKHWGAWIGVHAAARKPTRNEELICGRAGLGTLSTYPRGCLLGAMRVDRCVNVATVDLSDPICASDWGDEDSPFWWVIGAVVQLPKPIACTGRQRLWTCPDEAAHQVAELIAAHRGD